MQLKAEQHVAPTRRQLAGCIFGTAVGAGLATGLIEGLWLWFNQASRGRVIFTSDYVLWMTPLLYALIFLLVAVGFTVLALALYPRIKAAHAVFTFVAMAILCLFIPITQIARWAALVVAVGVAAQVARVSGSRPQAYRAVAARSLWCLGGVALLIYAGGRVLSRTPAPGALARENLPNVVLFVWDTVRSENLSLYGYAEPTTPGLERLAAEAVVFDHAVSPSPWTLPAHASMFTGRWPGELSTGWLEALDDEYPTLAEVLSANGYATGGFVANQHYTSYDSGLQRGFHEYSDYRVTFRQFMLSSWLTQTPTVADLLASDTWAGAWGAIRSMNFWVDVKRANDRKHAEEVNDELFAWLDSVGDRPFFAFLNYFDAHASYWSPPGTKDRFTAEDAEMRGYDAAIAYLDSQVTVVIDSLRERGLLDNTVIVITSDHGELFGEKGLRGHAHNLYYPTLHVPLLIYGPQLIFGSEEGSAGGRRVDREVSTRDLPATILELVDIAIDDEADIAGSSLSRFWGTVAADTWEPVLAEVEEGRNNAPTEPISRGPMKSVLSDSLHYILNGDGVEELYNFLSDPRAEWDLAAESSFEPALERFRSVLSRHPRIPQ